MYTRTYVLTRTETRTHSCVNNKTIKSVLSDFDVCNTFESDVVVVFAGLLKLPPT